MVQTGMTTPYAFQQQQQQQGNTADPVHNPAGVGVKGDGGMKGPPDTGGGGGGAGPPHSLSPPVTASQVRIICVSKLLSKNYIIFLTSPLFLRETDDPDTLFTVDNEA